MKKTDPQTVIYHNKSCSKSSAALAALTANKEDFVVINYLEEVPSIPTLKTIVQKLNCKPHELIRINEKLYQEQFKGKTLTDDEWITVMHENPILIQRPIIVNGDEAFIARTADSLDNLFETKKG